MTDSLPSFTTEPRALNLMIGVTALMEHIELTTKGRHKLLYKCVQFLDTVSEALLE